MVGESNYFNTGISPGERNTVPLPRTRLTVDTSSSINWKRSVMSRQKRPGYTFPLQFPCQVSLPHQHGARHPSLQHLSQPKKQMNNPLVPNTNNLPTPLPSQALTPPNQALHPDHFHLVPPRIRHFRRSGRIPSGMRTLFRNPLSFLRLVVLPRHRRRYLRRPWNRITAPPCRRIPLLRPHRTGIATSSHWRCLMRLRILTWGGGYLRLRMRMMIYMGMKNLGGGQFSRIIINRCVIVFWV
jgi:hypothetical protein